MPGLLSKTSGPGICHKTTLGAHFGKPESELTLDSAKLSESELTLDSANLPSLQHQNLVVHTDYNQYITISQGFWGCLWLGLLPPSPAKSHTPSISPVTLQGTRQHQVYPEMKKLLQLVCPSYMLCSGTMLRVLHELSHLMIPITL